MTGRHWEDGGPRAVGSRYFAPEPRLEHRLNKGARMLEQERRHARQRAIAPSSIVNATRCANWRRTSPQNPQNEALTRSVDLPGPRASSLIFHRRAAPIDLPVPWHSATR